MSLLLLFCSCFFRLSFVCLLDSLNLLELCIYFFPIRNPSKLTEQPSPVCADAGTQGYAVMGSRELCPFPEPQLCSAAHQSTFISDSMWHRTKAFPKLALFGFCQPSCVCIPFLWGSQMLLIWDRITERK